MKEYGDSRLQKMCCVLRTRGEKRLAAHLLPGLELLLNPECGLQLSIDGETLQAAFLARNSGRISFSNAEGDPLSIPSIQPTVWVFRFQVTSLFNALNQFSRIALRFLAL